MLTSADVAKITNNVSTEPHVAKITKQLIDQELTATIREYRPKVIWDSELKGFGIRLTPESRINPRGKAVYILQKWERGRGTRKIRHTFGSYPELSVQEARDKALSIIAQIRGGQYVSPREQNKRINQLRAEQAKVLTFEQVFEQYYKRNHKRGRYWDKDIPYSFNADILPTFGKLSITSITKADCRSLIRAKEETSKSAAKALGDRLRPVFRFALSEDFITINPMDGILPPKKGNARERVLDDDEIKAYWLAADQMSKANHNNGKTGILFGSFLKLLLLTGQRRNEVAGMEWSELNLAEGIWTIASHRAKNSKAHIVHLSKLATDILNQIPRTHEKFVFTKTQHSHINGFGATKEKLDSLMLLYLGNEFPHFTLHDIRRTFTTKMAQIGVHPDIADRILNHVSESAASVKGVYQRYEFLPERKAAMEKWNNYIEQLVAGC